MDITTQLRKEIDTINRTLRDFAIDAGTRPAWTTVAGHAFVAYGLRTGAQQRISDITRLLPELSERLSASRRQPTPVRLREMPLALEVNHPTPQPLDWRGAALRIGAGRLLAGRNYSASPAQDCIVDLASKPHALVAGATNSGKSTMLRMMLASLAYSTPPETLRLILVDRKNEDLVPFANLPHVETAAWTATDARRTVALVYAELQRRVEAGLGDWPRLVLAIDELAQLDEQSLSTLGQILAVGRSKKVHVIAATQHPTVKLIGDKSNFTVRIVGQVVDAGTAAIATGRKGTGAELLPGAGAFLYVDGAQLDRLQAYNLTADAATNLIAAIADKWGAAPVRTGTRIHLPPAAPPAAPPAPVRTSAEPPAPHQPLVTFPLPRRAPTAEEAQAIRLLHAQLGSQNKTIEAAYGSKSSETHRWVAAALAATDAPQAPILRMAGVR